MLPKGVGPVLRKTDVDFLSQLVRNDVVAIQHRLSKIGTSSFQMEAMIVHEGRQEVVCTAKEVLVMYDFIKRKKAPIPERKADHGKIHTREQEVLTGCSVAESV